MKKRSMNFVTDKQKIKAIAMGVLATTTTISPIVADASPTQEVTQQAQLPSSLVNSINPQLNWNENSFPMDSSALNLEPKNENLLFAAHYSHSSHASHSSHYSCTPGSTC